MAAFQGWDHFGSVQAFRRITWVSVACLHTSASSSPQMTTRTAPGGAFKNQWSSVWSEWNMDNDHTEKQETVASWLTLPACKTGKTKTTTDYFYYQIKPKRSYSRKSPGDITDITSRHICTLTRTQFSSQLHRDIKENKGKGTLRNSALSGV